MHTCFGPQRLVARTGNRALLLNVEFAIFLKTG